MKIIKYFTIIFILLSVSVANTDNDNFHSWLKSFKVLALNKNISENTFDMAMIKM